MATYAVQIGGILSPFESEAKLLVTYFILFFHQL